MKCSTNSTKASVAGANVSEGSGRALFGLYSGCDRKPLEASEQEGGSVWLLLEN